MVGSLPPCPAGLPGTGSVVTPAQTRTWPWEDQTRYTERQRSNMSLPFFETTIILSLFLSHLLCVPSQPTLDDFQAGHDLGGIPELLDGPTALLGVQGHDGRGWGGPPRGTTTTRGQKTRSQSTFEHREAGDADAATNISGVASFEICQLPT